MTLHLSFNGSFLLYLNQDLTLAYHPYTLKLIPAFLDPGNLPFLQTFFSLGSVPDLSTLSLHSSPIFIYTNHNWAIISTIDNIVFVNKESSPETIYEPLTFSANFKVPDLSKVNPSDKLSILPALSLPDFNHNLSYFIGYNSLTDKFSLYQTINKFNAGFIESTNTKQLKIENTTLEDAFSSLVKKVHHLDAKFISFELATDLLNKGDLVNFKYNPEIQPTSYSINKILTFTDKHGHNYFTIGKFNPAINQINPPE